MTHTITLSWFELSLAASVGVRRNVEALRRGLRDRHGFTGSGWGVHAEGAAAEMAVAKLLNIYWDGYVGSEGGHRGDVGRLQVRLSSREDLGLLIRPGDSEADTYVSLTGSAPTFTYRGWITGQGAKVPEFFRDLGNGRPPAYVVPHDHLNPDLPEFHPPTPGGIPPESLRVETSG